MTPLYPALWSSVVRQARSDMKRRGVALLAGFGGYPSFAPAVAAKSLKLPLLLHEQATRLSMANRRLLAYADALAPSFPNVVGPDGFDPDRVTESAEERGDGDKCVRTCATRWTRIP